LPGASLRSGRAVHSVHTSRSPGIGSQSSEGHITDERNASGPERPRAALVATVIAGHNRKSKRRSCRGRCEESRRRQATVPRISAPHTLPFGAHDWPPRLAGIRGSIQRPTRSLRTLSRQLPRLALSRPGFVTVQRGSQKRPGDGATGTGGTGAMPDRLIITILTSRVMGSRFKDTRRSTQR
jgi:hypothetical protein